MAPRLAQIEPRHEEDPEAGGLGGGRVLWNELTVAWVNRVFRDKPGGLVVAYLGLGRELVGPHAPQTVIRKPSRSRYSR